MKPSGKHGPTLQTWRAMLRRCQNENAVGYANYGGRGITVCARWQRFDLFLADMGPRPNGTSIDRIDNNGHYEPGNCRWATDTQQARNKRSNVLYEYEGEPLCVVEIAERSSTRPALLKSRLRNDWSLDRAVSEPARRPSSESLQRAMRRFQDRRAALEAQGWDADEIANRVPRMPLTAGDRA